jgi:tRNA pseudouridine55 synthase
MNGFLNINKPTGLTSHDVVARVRRLAGKGVKVGHAGTLDPAADGVLPLALGSATRLIEYLTDARKGYRGVVRLGVRTDSDDAEGAVIAERPVPPLDAATIAAAVAPLRGTISQIPPAYSAIHVDGKRAYDLARSGEHVELTPRTVTIERLDVVATTATTLTIDVECSTGTYIRALARDIGAHLGCGAHLAALTRTFVGAFTLDNATALADLQAHPELLAARLLPPETAIIAWPAIFLDGAAAQRVRNGLPLTLPAQPGERLRAHAAEGALVALLKREGDQWWPIKVVG